MTITEDILPTQSYQPTPSEQRAFADMQARLVALLLRFDEKRFARRYTLRASQSAETNPDVLRPYRDLAALMLLRDELFDDILPRIVRRLSFEAPRQIVVEEPPPRGRVDWERTLDATWVETPGATPLLVHTRQRRRDFATPEDVLAVAVLLEYRVAVLQLLWDNQLVARADVLRHPLNAITERCERELAFPQFAGLRTVAEQIVEREGVDDLVQEVQEQAIAGGNSGYDDLIDWRERLRTLPLLRRDTTTTAALALGADPQHDNYLYQLWLFYELTDLLHERGCLDDEGRTTEPMCLRFRWHGCVYEVRHDQAVPLPVASWKAKPNQNYHVPGVRPDFYLWRVMPPVEQVRDGATLVWREPGVVWDAKYYRESDSSVAPSVPIKRMIADLDLLGERYGVLLFAFKQSGTDGEYYTLSPNPGHDQPLTPDQTVVVRSLQPVLPASGSAVRDVLIELLNDMHERLALPRVPRCHGIFLDALSAADVTPLADRWAQPLNDDASNLLICPKPHIGSWRIDLVSRRTHCCNDARLCHIINQPNAQKPVRPPRDINDLLGELDHVLSDQQGQGLDEEAISAVAERVQQLTRRFADFVGVDFEFYYNRLRDLGMADTLDMLGPVERESLALSEFLKDQLDRIKAHDFSASAIHISSVMEVEIKRRVFACPGLVGELANPKRHTLGVLPFLRRVPITWLGSLGSGGETNTCLWRATSD